MGLDLRELIFSDADNVESERLHQTEIAQPALYMISFALSRWWQSLGVDPAQLIGHSVGEFAAAAIAGVMSMEEGARLVAIRGRLMQALPAGSMMAVQMSEQDLQNILPASLEIAAINGPAFCVVSGTTEDVDAFAQTLAGRGDEVASRPLKTSHAFHSRMMDAAIEPFELEVRKVNLQQPTIPIISSVTGRLMENQTATDPTYWARQIREPVRFSNAIENILSKSEGQIVLLEVGPNQALSTLCRQQPLVPDQHHIVSSLPHVKQKVSSAYSSAMAHGRLWQLGVPFDVNAIYHGEDRRRVHLPKYRFQRERFSFETDLATSSSAPVASQVAVDSSNSQEDAVRLAAPVHSNVSEVQPLFQQWLPLRMSFQSRLVRQPSG